MNARLKIRSLLLCLEKNYTNMLNDKYLTLILTDYKLSVELI